MAPDDRSGAEEPHSIELAGPLGSRKIVVEGPGPSKAKGKVSLPQARRPGAADNRDQLALHAPALTLR